MCVCHLLCKVKTIVHCQVIAAAGHQGEEWSGGRPEGMGCYMCQNYV